MKAQQDASARLEKDLMKARADLQSIYAGRRRADVGGKAPSVVLSSEAGEERSRIALSEGALDEVGCEGDEPIAGGECLAENPTVEEKRSGGVSAKQIPAEPVATHVVEGSHLARVLAVLLGEHPTAAEAAAPRASNAPSRSLRLKDFPPTIQAIFGEGVGPAATPAAATLDPAMGSKGTHERCGETRLSRRTRRWARGSPIEVDKSMLCFAGKAAATEHRGVNTAATSPTGRAGVDGCGRKEDRRDDGQESCSLAGGFQGYKAKSSLLQKWMSERVFPSLSQSDA